MSEQMTLALYNMMNLTNLTFWTQARRGSMTTLICKVQNRQDEPVAEEITVVVTFKGAGNK